MSSSADWFSRQLGQPQQAPPPARATPPSGPQPYRAPQPTHQRHDIKVTKENAFEVAGEWQGGEGTRTETENCPSCGSDLYFSRHNAPKVYGQNGVATAAAHCYACGYPNQQMGSA